MAEQGRQGLRVVTVAGQRVSDEVLPCDVEVKEVTDIELTPEQATAVLHSQDVVKILNESFDRVHGKPPEKSFNGAFVLLINERPEGNTFVFDMTDNVSLTFMLGCLEIAKNSVIQMIADEHMIEDEERDEDEISPP